MTENPNFDVSDILNNPALALAGDEFDQVIAMLNHEDDLHAKDLDGGWVEMPY